MSEVPQAGRACSAAVEAAFAVLGKRWNGMILEVLGGGPLSYVEIRRGVGGISDATLSDRLGELAGVGLVLRSVAAGPPLAVTYSLTDAGGRLMPIIDELAEWANASLELRTPVAQH